jgi:hypothetical protein
MTIQQEKKKQQMKMKARNERRYMGVFFGLYCSLTNLGLAMVFFGGLMYCILGGG